MALQISSTFAVVLTIAVHRISGQVPSSSARLSVPISHRIVNGSDADIASWPFMVAIRIKGHQACGGSLIHPGWVLTAAHCTQRTDVNAYSIQHSTTDAGGDMAANENTVAVAEIVSHEHYNASNQYIHDISLIRLARFVHTVRAFVQLPMVQFEDYAQGTPVTLIGWGLNATGGTKQVVLQQVELIVFSDEECARRHSEHPPHPSNVCGGVPEGGRGQCSGDSGGPLLMDGVQVGIVSWSRKPCAVYPYPGVFTQVSYYLGWIRGVVGRIYRHRI